jgi:hypothetical protein
MQNEKRNRQAIEMTQNNHYSVFGGGLKECSWEIMMVYIRYGLNSDSSGCVEDVHELQFIDDDSIFTICQIIFYIENFC